MTPRERRQAEEEKNVLDALKTTGGYFTTFWALQTQYRAAAIERLESRGAIATVRLQFPMMRAIIKSELALAL